MHAGDNSDPNVIESCDAQNRIRIMIKRILTLPLIPIAIIVLMVHWVRK